MTDFTDCTANIEINHNEHGFDRNGSSEINDEIIEGAG